MTEPPHDTTERPPALVAIAVAAHLHDTTVQHAAAALMLLDTAGTQQMSDTSADLLGQAMAEVRLALSTAREAMDRLDPAREHLDLPAQ